jgi:hypothetical protein
MPEFILKLFFILRLINKEILEINLTS